MSRGLPALTSRKTIRALERGGFFVLTRPAAITRSVIYSVRH
jgi:hypothetical protein